MADEKNEKNQEEVITIENPDVVTKYRTAGDIARDAFKKVVSECKAGADVKTICENGDKYIEEAVKNLYKKGKEKVEKGVAFPTCLSINELICYFSPLNSDDPITLKDGDVVKIELGVHVDGYAALCGETIVIGASAEKKIEGDKANIIDAAHYAGEVAIRLIKPGKKSSEVVKAVEKVMKEYGCSAIEGFSFSNMKKNVIDGDKSVILNPSDNQKSNIKEHEFELHEVYTFEIYVSNKEGKVKQTELRTSVYKKTESKYLLKMKTSRAVFSEISQKVGAMAFSLRTLEDEKKARMGIIECVKHELLTPYDVLEEKDGGVTSVLKFTVLLMPNGAIRLTPSFHDNSVIKSEKSIQDADIKAVLATSIKKKANKKKKKSGKSGEEGGEEEEEKK